MNMSINQKATCVLVGIKTDFNIKRVVSFDQGEALGKELIIKANRQQLLFWKASTKTAHNVKAMFQGLTKKMLKSGEGHKPSCKRPPLPIQQVKDQEYCKCRSN